MTRHRLMPPRHSPQVPKRQNIPDPLRAREEHAETIDAAAPASRGRQTPLQRLQIALVDLARLVRGLVVEQLLLELASLLKRRVLLLIGVDDFFAFDEEFAAGGDALVVGWVIEGFREWGETFWRVDDEGWALTLGLEVSGAELVHESRERRVFRDREGEVFEQLFQLGWGLCRRQVRERAANCPLDTGDKVDSAERG